MNLYLGYSLPTHLPFTKKHNRSYSFWHLAFAGMGVEKELLN